MPKFIWDDNVRIAEGVSASVRSGSAAVVVGVSEQGERHGSYLDRFPIGAVYTVEFAVEAAQTYMKINSSQ